MNRVRHEPAGYTIVETMIFLAVSAGLFLVAMVVVNGQQNKTEFATAVRDFDSKLSSIMGNVTTGFYNNADAVSCENIGGVPGPSSNPSAEQGQSGDCIYIGQNVDLAFQGDDQFTFTGVAGLRLNGTGQEVQTFAEAQPTVITSTAETYELLDGLTARMKITEGADIQTLGITTSFGEYGSEGLVSGNTQVNLQAGGQTNPGFGVQICITDGEQVGVIRVNTGGTQATIFPITASSPNPCLP